MGEITTDLGKHQHMHDRDDLHAEQVFIVADITILSSPYHKLYDVGNDLYLLSSFESRFSIVRK